MPRRELHLDVVVQGIRDSSQCVHPRAVLPGLESGDDRLAHADAFRQLALRESGLLPGVDEGADGRESRTKAVTA